MDPGTVPPELRTTPDPGTGTSTKSPAPTTFQNYTRPGQKLVAYDFSPFLSAPAVPDKSVEGRVQLVNIPQTRIPSPLAPNLSPGEILKLKQYLCGKGNGGVRIGGGYIGNGKEVWSSWKRAWDLWNNHYIDGRVDEAWIAAEWARRKKAKDDWDSGTARRRLKRRRDQGTGDDDDGLGPAPKRNRPNHPRQPPPPTTSSTFTTNPDPTDQSIISSGNFLEKTGETIQSFGHPAPNKESRPSFLGGPPCKARAGKKWVIDTRSRTIQENVWVEVDDDSNSVETFETPNPNASRTGRQQPPEIQLTSDTQKQVSDALQNTQARQDISQQNGALPPPRTQQTSARVRPIANLQHQLPVPGTRAALNIASQTSGTQQTPETQVALNRASQTSGTQRTSTRVRPIANLQHQLPVPGTRAALNIASQTSETQPTPETQPVTLPSTAFQFQPTQQQQATGSDYGDDSDQYNSPSDDEDPPEPSIINDDGSSAGFFPIKLLKEFKEPPVYDEDGDPLAVLDNHGNEVDQLWDDPIENSVWRPRRVGENDPVIGIDVGKGIGMEIGTLHAFNKESELNVDGGVDCGRLPYPVLRPLFEYVQKKTGPNPGFIKKKTWDRVTGTIFNMPTRPKEPVLETDDVRLKRVKDMFEDSIRDARLCDGPIFPLDIRRINKVVPADQQLPETPILASDEEFVNDRTNSAGKELYKPRDMEKNDPWYVTPEQQQLRDDPTRQWPPADQSYLENHIKTQESKDTLLYIDDTVWKEQRMKDDHIQSRYFATNLHGGTMLINGMEVVKGAVAGPLPEFAVIECPGGQVAFWWGINGRNYGAGPDGADYDRKWRTLRKLQGWQLVGMSAGEVWDMRFIDREKRERTGEPEADDEVWDRWKVGKRAKLAPGEGDPLSNAYNTLNPRRTDSAKPAEKPLIVYPVFKADEEEELAWLIAQVAARDTRAAAVPGPVLIEPGNQWPGAQAPLNTKPKAPTQAEIDALWTAQRDDVVRGQQALTAAFKDAEEAKRAEIARHRAEQEAATKQRQADGSFNREAETIAKEREARIIQLREQQDSQEAARIQEENVRILTDKLNARDREDAATLAALKRQWQKRRRQDPSNREDEPTLKDAQDVRREREHVEDEARKSENINRKSQNLPVIPQKQQLDMAAVEAARKKQAEEAKEEKNARDLLIQKRRTEQARLMRILRENRARVAETARLRKEADDKRKAAEDAQLQAQKAIDLSTQKTTNDSAAVQAAKDAHNNPPVEQNAIITKTGSDMDADILAEMQKSEVLKNLKETAKVAAATQTALRDVVTRLRANPQVAAQFSESQLQAQGARSRVILQAGNPASTATQLDRQMRRDLQEWVRNNLNTAVPPPPEPPMTTQTPLQRYLQEVRDALRRGIKARCIYELRQRQRAAVHKQAPGTVLVPRSTYFDEKDADATFDRYASTFGAKDLQDLITKRLEAMQITQDMMVPPEVVGSASVQLRNLREDQLTPEQATQRREENARMQERTRERRRAHEALRDRVILAEDWEAQTWIAPSLENGGPVGPLYDV